MLKNKNILILAAVLVVLLGISLVQKAGYKNSTTQSSTAPLVEETFTADQLDRITLGQGADAEAVVLLAGPTGWVVTTSWDAAASSQRIDALLRSLGGLSGEYRSDNEDVLADYGLADDKAVKIRAYDKEGALKIAVDVGGTPVGSSGNFVKKPGSNAVYISGVNLRSQLGIYDEDGQPGNKHFLDLQAVQEDRLEVDRIILDDGGQVLEMEKDFAPPKPAPGQTEAQADSAAVVNGPDRTTWEWEMTAPRAQALVKTKADQVLSSVVAIRAVDVEDPAGDMASYGLDAVLRTATLMRQDGTQTVLEFGSAREEAGDAPAGTRMRVHGKTTVWIVTDYTVNNIFKTETDLLPDQE
jgi:hypothetical protein